MRETRMRRIGVGQMTKGKLLDVSQPLKSGCPDYGALQLGKPNVAVNWVGDKGHLKKTVIAEGIECRIDFLIFI